jgi:hypothetical protein
MIVYSIAKDVDTKNPELSRKSMGSPALVNRTVIDNYDIA